MPSEEEMEKAFEGRHQQSLYVYTHALFYSFNFKVTCADVQDTDLFWMDTEHSAVKVMVETVLVVKMNTLEL